MHIQRSKKKRAMNCWLKHVICFAETQLLLTLMYTRPSEWWCSFSVSTVVSAHDGNKKKRKPIIFPHILFHFIFLFHFKRFIFCDVMQWYVSMLFERREVAYKWTIRSIRITLDEWIGVVCVWNWIPFMCIIIIENIIEQYTETIEFTSFIVCVRCWHTYRLSMNWRSIWNVCGNTTTTTCATFVESLSWIQRIKWVCFTLKC